MATETNRQAASIEPGLKRLLADLTARGLITPEPSEVGINEARRRNLAYFRAIAGAPPTPRSVLTLDITGETGGIAKLRIVGPKDGKPGAPALLYLHGGGYAFGDLDTHDAMFRWLAAASGMTVFGLHYRRTPEHAFPAQIHDALAAVAAIRSPAFTDRFGHDPDRLVLFGDSAGAHLCMSLMLSLRERSLPQPVAAGLAYGMYARRFDTWSHRTYGGGEYGLTSYRMRWFWDQLLAGQSGGVDPIAEPLLADLKGLPELAVYAAECDCLLDDTLDFWKRLENAGHRHRFHLFAGMPHAFLHLGGVYAGTRAAIERIGRDLREIAGG